MEYASFLVHPTALIYDKLVDISVLTHKILTMIIRDQSEGRPDFSSFWNGLNCSSCECFLRYSKGDSL